MLPSSFSLSALRSNSDSEKRSRKSSIRDRGNLEPTRSQRHRQHDEPVILHSKEALQGEPVPPPNRLRSKSRTWSARVSSFLPPLISSTADSPPQPVRRKTAAEPTEPRPPLPPPPPPYASQDSPASPSGPPTNDAARAESLESPSSPSSYSPTDLSIRQSSAAAASMPHLDTASITLVSSPEATPTAPSSTSSPESRPAALARLESAAQTGARGSHVAEGSADSQKQSKLQKAVRQSRRRSKSLHQMPLISEPRPAPGDDSTFPPELRGRRSFSAQAPSIVAGDTPGLRLTPPPPSANLRPRSSKGSSQSPSRGRFRRSWFPGGLRSRSSSVDPSKKSKSYAWIMSDDKTQVEYNTSLLKNGEKVPELWNESGVVHVYLYPRGSGCGPSFKVPEFTVSSSLNLNDATRMASPPVSPTLPESPGCMRLYLPAALPTGSGHLTAPGEGSHAELDRLIAIRNLFAFLTGQPLVGTKSKPTTFHAFLEIAELLQEFGFSGASEETFGEAVDLSFGFYSDQLGLADCRHSREKTLEALVLGERMRSLDLYNEAFAHAAGKYSAIKDLRLPLFEQISPHTRERLERAHFDLVNRQHNVNEHLEQFEFPSLFAGIANSSAFPELRQVRFKVWRNSFHRMRQFTLNYYKHTFGSWPPKASSKKNPFAESGLNRLVLKALYSDMCALYDMLVDRKNLTSRVIDEVPAISDAADKMATSALRNILSEFDRSKPPVLPPIPFDLPQLPSMTAIHETFNSLSAKVQNRFEKKIKEHELLLILNKAYNYDSNSSKLPFLQHFKDFEMRESKGKMCQDLVDQRIGYWIFLSVVLQSLPMLVVDAPGLQYSDGVEYFLCQPPMGNPPWVEDKKVRKMWYEVTGGGGRLVELSADAVMFSVEATYHRSHCWLAAQKWEGIEDADVSASGTPSPPPGAPQAALRPRNLSPGLNRSSQAWRSSIAIGLEPVPMEPPNVFGSHNRSSSLGPRPASSHRGFRSASSGNFGGVAGSTTSLAEPMITGATFDDILGATPKKASTKKKSRFF
ncbi:uncharacterized protein HRG_02620 [Hirsutella rhossiliensis]|uniref:DUF8004 domain-containing protein n=1 Tax=Hirsutella rhossiliensis TaxID=111463 RepID=A0A9P8N756_9HYPO|nr:uncharacterized protein HRG_02620 [Hirsutella rhossiliensis]KAH0967211.1 hypothetical protein HRG_02620 [Hirsutella rhossiliensis]